MYGVCFTCIGVGSTYTILSERVELKVYLINFSALTDCLHPLSHNRNVPSLAIFYCYFHALLILLNACLPSSRGLSAQAYLLSFIPILSISMMQELTSIRSHSSCSLVNSETPYLFLYLLLPMTWTLSREKFQDTWYLFWTNTFDYSGTGTCNHR